jgi:hypothetical protein
VNKEQLRSAAEITLNTTALLLLFRLITSSFSYEVREQIRKRAGYRSELSGRDDEPLECAHWNHDKTEQTYDDPDNGRLLLLSEHLQDHIDRAGENGLSESDNNYAIRTLERKLRDFYDERAYRERNRKKEQFTQLPLL